jgi:hypothetical protein
MRAETPPYARRPRSPIARWRGLLALATLGLAAACSGLRSQPPAPDLSHDERIQRDVEARLALEPVLEASRLRVAVRGGVVSLYGAVRGMGALQCAIATAQVVPNVRTVVDQMELEPGPREARCLMPRTAVSSSDRGPPRQTGDAKRADA